MARTFGDYNPALTNAVRRVSRDSGDVKVLPHAHDEMENDSFDLSDVFSCLCRGQVYGPENHAGNEVRANVIHQGLNIRVSIGGLGKVNGIWDDLKQIKVISVMKDKKNA